MEVTDVWEVIHLTCRQVLVYLLALCDFLTGSSTDLTSAIGDKELAAKAVAFVVSSTRRGIVAHCADVATVLRAKQRWGISEISGKMEHCYHNSSANHTLECARRLWVITSHVLVTVTAWKTESYSWLVRTRRWGVMSGRWEAAWPAAHLHTPPNTAAVITNWSVLSSNFSLAQSWQKHSPVCLTLLRCHMRRS